MTDDDGDTNDDDHCDDNKQLFVIIILQCIMPNYPCTVCGRRCDVDSVECSSSMMWTHR